MKPYRLESSFKILAHLPPLPYVRPSRYNREASTSFTLRPGALQELAKEMQKSTLRVVSATTPHPLLRPSRLTVCGAYRRRRRMVQIKSGSQVGKDEVTGWPTEHKPWKVYQEFCLRSTRDAQCMLRCTPPRLHTLQGCYFHLCLRNERTRWLFLIFFI